MRIRPIDQPADVHAIERLLEVVDERDGEWPLSEPKYADLVSGSPDAIGIVAETGGDVVGYAHLRPNREPGGWGLEVVSDDTEPAAYVELVRQAVAEVRDRGGSSVHHWITDLSLGDVLRRHDFALDRGLHRMRRRLPADALPQFPADVQIRAFDPATDVDAWLEVNNAAFAGHAENGNWDRAVMESRMRLAWFDPAGFRMAWIESDLAAFCWTKVHADGVGEIYVIAVNPAHQGKGLGTAIVLEGLRFLSADAGAPAAILYVDAANTAGIRLYTKLGFVTEHESQAFVWQARH